MEVVNAVATFVAGEKVMYTIPATVLVARCRHRTFLVALFASATAALLTIAAPAHAQSTGIAVCDDFLTKYEACISSKVPAAQQAMFKGQLDQTRRTWSDIAKNPRTRSSLEGVCKQSIDQIKVAFQPYGCAF
jgi:hypothetical protein